MVRVDKMKYYDIYSNQKGGFIVYNRRKEFSEGHTHINNFKTARYIAYLSLYKKKPKGKLSPYLIESIVRISDDKKYIRYIQQFARNNKKRNSH